MDETDNLTASPMASPVVDQASVATLPEAATFLAALGGNANVYVCIYSHAHGEDVTVALTMNGIMDWLYAVVCEWWGDVAEYNSGMPTSPPEDHNEAVSIYFSYASGEYYNTTQVAVRP